MKSSDIEEVNTLLKHRAGFLRLIGVCESHPFICQFIQSGAAMEVGSFIDLMSVRKAIQRAAEDEVKVCESRLETLGVEIA